MSYDTAETFVELPANTDLLRGQYKILRCLSQGGFGITYLAQDSLQREVVLKECFAAQLCTRDGLDVRLLDDVRTRDFGNLLAHFKKEAYRLAALDHPGIVSVHQVFAENQTAYMAMDYCRGNDLFTVVDETPERMTEDLMKEFLCQALLSINYTHERGFLHRDIAPDNFLLDGNDHAILIDYGSAADIVQNNKPNATRLLAVKDGYSPFEFYASSDAQDASSDLYSLGATLHFMITGDAPPNSQSRLSAVSSGEPDPFEKLTELDWDVSQSFLDPINQALSLHQRDRLRSAAEWLDRMTENERSSIANMGPIPIHEIGSTISRLVSETNSGLTRGLPKSMQSQKILPKEEPQKPEKRVQPVDIFGNPIHDVDAYLKEQERAVPRRRPRAAGGRVSKPRPRKIGIQQNKIEEDAVTQ
ncbi:MAG: serine/threonine-protein kinase [Pseudomonadota bacterium]